MEPNQYIKNCLRLNTNQKKPIPENILHAGLGIATESGELLDAIKRYAFYGNELDIYNLKEELGDLCWYMSLMLAELDLEWEEVWEANIEKLKIRYPEGFTEEKALNRNLEEERKSLEQ